MKNFLSFARAAFVSAAVLSAGAVHSAPDLSQLSVAPNPVRAALGQSQAVFNDVTEDVRVRIYTARGVLVRELSASASGGSLAWDLKNEAGEFVASGVYVCLVTNASGEVKRTKLAIIR